ncbi:MAG: hypothetical protein V1808_04930 [Candidatus Daviesbacteria bacterium]
MKREQEGLVINEGSVQKFFKETGNLLVLLPKGIARYPLIEALAVAGVMTFGIACGNPQAKPIENTPTPTPTPPSSDAILKKGPCHTDYPPDCWRYVGYTPESYDPLWPWYPGSPWSEPCDCDK